MLCLEDNKEYTSRITALETEDGLALTDEDLVPGRKVIWTYRKMPYAAEVIKVNGKYKCEKHVHVLRMHSYL